MRSLIIGVALLAVSCGASSPIAPSAPTVVVVPPASVTTITGHVTATNGGQPLGGLSAALAAATTTTDGTGMFRAQTPQTTSANLLLTGATIVPRSITVGVVTSRDIAVNAITLGGGFDLNFYRQIVRNGSEGGNEPLRRWTSNPRIHIKTVREDGVDVDSATIETTARVIQASITAWTQGKLSVAAIERDASSRLGQAGWIDVQFPTVWNQTDSVCGRADVGGGHISFWVPTGFTCGCSANGGIRESTITHEVGHALGFWHTDSPEDVMYPFDFSCQHQPSARELLHAAVAYSRPVGNVDPDTDPAGTVSLAPMRVR